MRFFEILLIVALLASIFTNFKIQNFKISFLLPLSILLVFSMHLLLEGLRWQMIPAYLVISVIIFYLLKKNIHQPKFLLFFEVLFLLISVVLSNILPVFKFQKPAGKYTIGTTTFNLTDNSRNEIFSADKNRKRQLVVQVWYPSDEKTTVKKEKYIENARIVTSSLLECVKKPGFLFDHLQYVNSNAVKNLKIPDQKFPLLIYVSGLYGNRSFNNFQVQELVSQGYIVAGIDNPGEVAATVLPDKMVIKSLPLKKMNPLIHQSFEDVQPIPQINGNEMKAGIIPYFAKDVSFVIDFLEKLNAAPSQNVLKNHLNLDRIGVFGVSLGAMVTAEAASYDKRIKAVLIMEAPMTKNVMRNGIKIPTMIMTRDAQSMRTEREKSGGWTEKDIQQHLYTMTKTFEKVPENAYFLQIPGAFHADFLDVPLWIPYGKYLGITGNIKPKEIHRMINDFTINFFNKELKNIPSGFLENPKNRYKNIIYQSH